MKHWICILLCMTACVSAGADELAKGVKAWEQRDFATAQATLAPLAAAGNAEAQLLLGEMVGYGEGVPEDLAQAERLLGQALAGGRSEAAASLADVRQRAARKADIARYLDGASAVPTLEQFGCVMPAFPEASRTQKEIRAVATSMAEWRSCYQRYAAQLAQAAANPPADLARLMNLVELERAAASRNQAMARAVQAAQSEVAAFGRATDKWFAATRNYSQSMEKITREESDLRLREAYNLADMARSHNEARAHGFMIAPAR